MCGPTTWSTCSRLSLLVQGTHLTSPLGLAQKPFSYLKNPIYRPFCAKPTLRLYRPHAQAIQGSYPAATSCTQCAPYNHTPHAICAPQTGLARSLRPTIASYTHSNPCSRVSHTVCSPWQVSHAVCAWQPGPASGSRPIAGSYMQFMPRNRVL